MNLSQPASSPAKRTPQQRLRRLFFVGLRAIVVAYLVICVGMVVMEPRLVYPGAYMQSRMSGVSTPSSGQIVTVPYQAADGTPLRGRYLANPEATETVLFLHGNGIQAIWLDGWIKRLGESLDASVLAAEYRGFLDDEVTPSEAGVVQDSLAALDELCRLEDVRSSEVVVYGRSLGGGAAAAVADRRPLKAVVLDRTFDRMVDVAAERYPHIPVQLLMRNRFDSVERLALTTTPVIQVHGTADAVIPIQHARNLHKAIVKAPKVWIQVPAMGHNDRLPEKILEQIRDFLRDLPSSEQAELARKPRGLAQLEPKIHEETWSGI